MSGVTRRRQAAGSSTNNDAGVPSRTTTPARPNGSAARDQEAANDHKVAYDPKDIEQGEERAKQPKLTLMEEVLLLGLKDREVRHTRFSCFPRLFIDVPGLSIVLERQHLLHTSRLYHHGTGLPRKNINAVRLF